MENIFKNIFQFFFEIIGVNFLFTVAFFILFSTILLLFPLPSSVVLIFSGIFFEHHSFLINLIVLNSSSMITYFTIKRLFQILNRLPYNLKPKIDSLSVRINNTDNLKELLLFRIFLPFSVFNYSAGFLKLSFKKLILVNFVGLIPRVLMISSLGASISITFIENNNLLLTFFSNIYTRIFVLAVISIQLIKKIKKAKFLK